MLFVDECLHDGRKRVAQEDGDDGRRRLVGTEAVIVSGRGDGHAQEVCVLVDGGYQAGEEHEELQVVLRMWARLKQVLAVGRKRPVVMLARAVDVLKRLLVLQAHEAMV